MIRDATLLHLGRQLGDPTEAPSDLTLMHLLERMAEATPLACSGEPADLYFLRPADRTGLLGLLGGYEVQEVVGAGGMGVVLKAYETALRRLVAIKVLAPALAGSAAARRRFTREAQAAAAVSHDHIVPVFGVHEEGGVPYLVMQYVVGESLQHRLDRLGALDLTEIIRIGQQTATGLAAAHAQGLIHRDIKPANLLLENGLDRVKITDFGLARMVDDVQLTQTGVIAGTPEYMSPEQARGEALDTRADLFSLGGVMYAMCTGVPPFRAASAVALLRMVSDQEPAPIRSLNPDIPDWLELLIDRLLAKDPADRIPSAAQVAELLQGYLAHLEQPEMPPPPFPVLGTANGQGEIDVIATACSSCHCKVKVRPERAGKRVKCPKCGQPILVPAATPARLTWFVPLCAALGLGAILCLVGALLLLRPVREHQPENTQGPKPSFVDVVLGNRTVEGVDDAGFYNDEQNDTGPFRWTDGKAKLVIPLNKNERPQALYVKVLRLKSTWLRITVNDRQLANEPAADEDWWERKLDLSGIELGEMVVVEITCSTIVAKVDSRPLGVRVVAIQLLREGVDKPPPSILGLPLGGRAVTGIEDSGFQAQQQDKSGPYSRFTNGARQTRDSIRRQDPAQIKLSMLLHRPKHSSLRINVNQQELVNEKPAETEMYWWERTFDLGGIDLGEAITLEILSEAIDKKAKGVQVRWIKLLSSQPPVSFVDVPLGGKYVPGVKEAGFSFHEAYGDQSCRWTDGSATMTIPLAGKKPRALALSAFIPSQQGYSVRVTANGKKLFDGPVQSNNLWSVELPLSGVDLGNSIHVELDSSTLVPAKVDTKNRDSRVLGIRVLRLQLLSAPDGQAK